MKSGSKTKSNWFFDSNKLVNVHSSPSFYTCNNSSPFFCCNRVKNDCKSKEDLIESIKNDSSEGSIMLNFDKKSEKTQEINSMKEETEKTINTNVSESKSPAHTPLSFASHSVPNLSTTSRLRYKLIKECEAQVCRLNHTKTVVSKIMNSRYLRRWENHTLVLSDSEIYSSTPTGFMETSIPYSSIQDVNEVTRWDAGHKYCLRITVSDGSVLIQAGNSYLRNQWFHSIQWKKHVSKYDKLLRNTKRIEVLIKEIKQLIDVSLSTPIQDDSVSQFPLDLLSLIIKKNEEKINNETYEEIIVALAPLLDKNHPTKQMYQFFIRQCRNSPRSPVTQTLFNPIIHRILKHNVEVGRYIAMQSFIQEYLKALQSHNNSKELIFNFVKNLHGPSAKCPHPRMLPNLVAICLSSIFTYYDQKKNSSSEIGLKSENVEKATKSSISDKIDVKHNSEKTVLNEDKDVTKNECVSFEWLTNNENNSSINNNEKDSEKNENISQKAKGLNFDNDTEETEGCGNEKSTENNNVAFNGTEEDNKTINSCNASTSSDDEENPIQIKESCNESGISLQTYFNILLAVSEYEDWRLQFAKLLQPIPFPDMALKDSLFMRSIKPILSVLMEDVRCEVHSTLLGAREGKEGWFELYHKELLKDDDEGFFYGNMLKRLISCCCRRRKFFLTHIDMVSAWQLMALRGHPSAIEALCLVLEHEVCEDNDLKVHLVAALQASELGKQAYNDLSVRLIQLQGIQQKGGPRKLSLPSNFTDDDLHVMISSGSFGNLEYLSLAFTQVTSGCALDLIKLPSLLYLNLWSTQFGDQGLQMISEYMPRLQVLNLCETPVTDKGLSCLAAMRNLRRLNLNSTHLSAPTFQVLKEKLPSLQEVDVRYTDAW